MAAQSTFPTSGSDLRGLYARNIGRMPQVALRMPYIKALWWGGYRRLRRWRIIPNPHYASWRMQWNDRSGAALIFAGRRVPLGPGRLVAIPPRTLVSCRLERPVWHFYINFLLGYPYDNVTPRVVSAPLPPSLRTAVLELTKVDPGEGRLGIRNAVNLQLLMAVLLREIDDADLGARPTDERVRRVLSVLDQNPDLSNAELARVAGMSTNGFHRLFREQVGVTPHAYVVGKKMELACSLLQHTGDTMDEIAASCGFNDRAYLARTFRRQFLMSPGEYRRRHRG